MNLPELLKIAEAAHFPVTQNAQLIFRDSFNPSVAIELIKRLQEAEKDAERYKWLKKVGCDSWLYQVKGVKVYPTTAICQTRLSGQGEKLDAAIDTAMNGGKE